MRRLPASQGFPGRLTARARYAVTGDRLTVLLTATTDALTVVNLTNHLYVHLGDHGDSVADQTRSCLAEVDRILAEAGTDKTRILSAQIWMADMANFAEMNAVWDAWVPKGNTPARATGEARLATPAYLVEVKKAAESKAPYDYLKVRATIPADQAFRPMDQGGCAMVAKK